MPDHDELSQPVQPPPCTEESVDFGDLQKELEKHGQETDDPLARPLGSVDFGDLKNELGKGKPADI